MTGVRFRMPRARGGRHERGWLGRAVVEEFGFVDDEVPAVGAVLAAVGEDVAGLGKMLGIECLHEVRAPSAVDTDDHRRDAHAFPSVVKAQTPYSGSPGPGGVQRRAIAGAKRPECSK